MRLSRYLEWKREAPEKFAGRAGVHRATIYRLLKHNGYQPKGDTIQRIERASGGKVRLPDLLSAADA